MFTRLVLNGFFGNIRDLFALPVKYTVGLTFAGKGYDRSDFAAYMVTGFVIWVALWVGLLSFFEAPAWVVAGTHVVWNLGVAHPSQWLFGAEWFLLTEPAEISAYYQAAHRSMFEVAFNVHTLVWSALTFFISLGCYLDQIERKLNHKGKMHRDRMNLGIYYEINGIDESWKTDEQIDQAHSALQYYRLHKHQMN